MPVSLTYFGFDGSRGLECRLALTAAGIDFEDIRINREQWAALKPTTPFGALPLLTVGERKVAQSNAILTVVGRNHHLHPEDPWIAAKHDAILCSVEDLRYKMPADRKMSDEDKKAAREEFTQSWLTQWAATVSDAIEGPFLEGEKLNVADIKLYVILRAFLTGTYDHIPVTVFDAWPKIKGLYAAADEHPSIRAWFDKA